MIFIPGKYVVDASEPGWINTPEVVYGESRELDEDDSGLEGILSFIQTYWAAGWDWVKVDTGVWETTFHRGGNAFVKKVL